jgi:hypothetical protein
MSVCSGNWPSGRYSSLHSDTKTYPYGKNLIAIALT